MSGFCLLSGCEQVAAYLRDGLICGRWRGVLPGRARLAAELGVSGKIVEAALVRLEREGFLTGHGPRRRRGIVLSEDAIKSRTLRVAFMLYEAGDANAEYVVELQHLLTRAGHQTLFAPLDLTELRLDVERVARVVGKIQADAWVVVGGSMEVLRWFGAQAPPTFAFFGRQQSIPVAGIGPDHLPAMLAAVRRLLDLGHRRIVMMARPERRVPVPGRVERAMLAELAAKGIATGRYNLPEWDGTRNDFYRCLDALYRITPPTALIIDEAPVFIAAQQYLARRGVLAPEHVSLLCCDPSPSFAWFELPVTHIRWDFRPLVRRVMRWIDNVVHGKTDLRQSYTKARFVEGGTIGPAPPVRGATAAAKDELRTDG